MLFSVTELSSYDYCKRKFYLQKRYNLKEPIKPALILGTIKHSTFEEFTKKEKNIIKKLEEKNYDLESLKYFFYEEYLKILKNNIIKNKEKLFDFNISIEEAYEKSKKIFLADSNLRAKIFYNTKKTLEEKKEKTTIEEIYNNLNPKIISEKKIILEKYNLKGIIDRILLEEKEDKKIIRVYEFKSGKAPKNDVWNSHKIQVYSYLTLLKETTKETIIKEGIINYIDENKEFTIKYNPFIKIEVLKKIEELKELLEGKIPEKTTNKNKCALCGLKKICYDEKKLKELEEKYKN